MRTLNLILWSVFFLVYHLSDSFAQSNVNPTGPVLTLSDDIYLQGDGIHFPRTDIYYPPASPPCTDDTRLGLSSLNRDSHGLRIGQTHCGSDLYDPDNGVFIWQRLFTANKK